MKDKTAENKWDKFDIAMSNFQKHIERKENKFSLSIVDLLHVSNFKGGNGSITEPEEQLPDKLKPYSKKLEEIDKFVDSKKLGKFKKEELPELIKLGVEFLELTEKKETKISGLGASYASALMCAHFLDVLPIIDRRVLNGAEIEGVKYSDKKKTIVKNIISHYGQLIEKFHKELINDSGRSLREQDKFWFSKKIKKNK
jgi:hypothetical protein